jgi:hypothetical protein
MSTVSISQTSGRWPVEPTTRFESFTSRLNRPASISLATARPTAADARRRSETLRLSDETRS